MSVPSLHVLLYRCLSAIASRVLSIELPVFQSLQHKVVEVDVRA
jgi:hypothetical protein